MNMASAGANFWLGATLLCLLTMAAVLAPWFLRSSSRSDRRSAVVDFAKTRLAEIDSDFRSGAIGADEYHQLTLEQQRRVLQEADAQEMKAQSAALARHRARIVLIVFAVAAPFFAGAFYFYSGNWADWRVQQLLERSRGELEAGNDNRATLEQLRAALATSLARHDDKDGRRRFMLARLAMEFQDYAAAAAQFELLLQKFPDDAGVAAQYAQALYLSGNRRLTPEVLAQAQRALQLDPNQTTALGLLGIAAFEHKDFAQAVLHWRHLLRLLPPTSPSRPLIEQGIEQAEQQLGPHGLPGPKFVVSVTLSNELAKARPAGTLFVFAKAVKGPPLPLAVARLDSAQLPLEVTLDNSMAMAPGMDLSSAKQVQIFARITASGQVRGEPGDLEGNSTPLTVGDTVQKVSLTIDRRL